MITTTTEQHRNATTIPTVPIKYSKRNAVCDVLTMTCIVIIFLLYCAGIFVFVANRIKTYENPEDKKWNHGVCMECNTSWHYKESVGHKYDTTYIYECECGEHHIELQELH